MKKTLVTMAVASITVLALMLTGCASSPKQQAKIDFKTETMGNFECSNFSDSDLVLFAGRVERNFILGGIKSGETRQFDLSKISEMPKQGAFIMRAVPYEAYKTKEKFLHSDNAVYTKLVVYDLDSEEKSKATIEPAYGILSINKYGFIVDNETPFIVELRMNNPQGESIAVVPPHYNGLKVYGFPDDNGLGYQIFPVYIYAKEGSLYAHTGRDRFRIQMLPIEKAYSYRINTSKAESLQNSDPIYLFGE